MNGDGLIVAGLICLVVTFGLFFSTPGLLARAAVGLLGALFGYRDILKDGRLYLRRYFITPRRWLGYDQASGRSRWPFLLGWVPRRFRKIFVHHILLSDDRTPHDHPWDFTTRILSGEYVEWIGSNRYRSRLGTPGTVLRNRAEHVHTLEIVRPVWSLVFAGESRRVWGFWETHEDGVTRWENWRSYLGCEFEKTAPEDQIDPSRYLHNHNADNYFAAGFVAEGNIRQPTAYWRDPRRVTVIGHEPGIIDGAYQVGSSIAGLDYAIEPTEWLNQGPRIIPIEVCDPVECCPARCGGYCAIPIAVDDVPTRKIDTRGYVGSLRDDGPAGEDAPKGRE